jgi:anti-sigma factor RsiW
MMTCEQWREDISAWIDGELSQYQTREVAQHVKTCSDCRRVFDEFRQISALSRSQPIPTVSPHVTDAAMALVRAAHERRSFWRETVLSFSWPKLTLAVCGTALAGVLALTFAQGMFDNPYAPSKSSGAPASVAATGSPTGSSSDHVIAGELSVADASQGTTRVTAFAHSLGGEAHTVAGVRGSTVFVTIPSGARDTFISGLSGLGQWHGSVQPTAVDGSLTVGIKIVEQP